MTEQQFDSFFAEQGFRSVEVNAAGLRVYLSDDAETNGCSLAVVYFTGGAHSLTREQQENVGRQLREAYGQKEGRPVQLLNILVTDLPAKARSLFAEGERCWVVDTAGGRLMLYEEQGDFCGLRAPLETAVFEERNQAEREAMPEKGSAARTAVQVLRRCPCNIALIAVNILVFLAAELSGGWENTWLLYEHAALIPEKTAWQQEYYRLLTYMFLHGGIDHLINNMLVLWFLGNHLEKQAGHLRYLLLYFGTGILAGIASMSYNIHIERYVVCVGASGAIFGVVGAVAMNILLHRGKVEELTAKQMLLFVVLSLYGGFTSQGVDNA
ncbi:MAG: rhomboid family intramembrane serine protease, partial [Lachnospiraceae bacterium]|nr:rhomboid family intramembrane serine protease [Lachnospiraceae bacterium]